MSRWVDLPLRVVGDTSADVDPVVVAMGLKERDRNRAFELRETMSPEAWREMMMEIHAHMDDWALAREVMARREDGR